MDKNKLLESIKEARNSKKKFTQSFDLVINLKNINIKKEDQKILTFTTLPFFPGKPRRITALVGKELVTKARSSLKNVIHLDDFKNLDKKAIKKIASETDFFIAQANVMPQIAATFGKILGPRGLMPNPKADCILQPTEEISQTVKRLEKTVRLETKNEPTIKAPIGSENMKDEEIAENALAVYNSLLPLLPEEKNNIKSIIVKLTMGKPAYVIGTKIKETEK